jgi:dynactin-5
MEIGNNVFVDKGSVICALNIGSNVHIGKNCIIGHRSKIHDNSKILDSSILAPDTVVPPYSVFGGQPAVFLGELPESM